MMTYAPATQAIQQRPVHELMQARKRIEDLGQILSDIEALLLLEDVCCADKLALLNERATTRLNIRACENIVAACEERIRHEARQIQQRHGWLL